MKVKNGDNISVHYRGTFKDGTEFDNSKTRGSLLNFEVGSGRMIPGFNDATIGMSPGETRQIVLPPEEAYGHREEQAIQDVPKSAFGENFEFLIGEVVQGNGPRGQFLARILEEKEDDVVLDFNHPLAGKELHFDIELVTINEVEDELPPMPWNSKMKKAELLEVAKAQGLSVNTRSTKAQIIEALDSL